MESRELNVVLRENCFSVVRFLLVSGHITANDIFKSKYIGHVAYNETLFQLLEHNITPEIASTILFKMLFSGDGDEISITIWQKLFETGGKLNSHYHWEIPDEIFLNYIQNYHGPYQLCDKKNFAGSLHHCKERKVNWFINEFANDDINSMIEILLSISYDKINYMLLFAQKNSIIYDNFKYFLIFRIIIKIGMSQTGYYQFVKYETKNIFSENDLKEILITCQFFKAINCPHYKLNNPISFWCVLPNEVGPLLKMCKIPNYEEIYSLVKLLPKEYTYDNIINYIDQLLLLMPPVINYVYDQYNKELSPV